MKTDARTPVTPLEPGVERVYLIAVKVPYRRNAEPPTYKVLERALRPAIRSIGGKWIKAQGYEDYNPLRGGNDYEGGGTTARRRPCPSPSRDSEQNYG
jgi:hypothetical protein